MVASVAVPDEVNDEVAVIVPPVILPAVNDEKNAVTPLMRVVKRLVEVAFVKVAFVAKRFVEVAFVLVLFVEVRPEKLPLVALKLLV